MLSALVGLWRRRPVVIYLIGGAILTGILLATIPFGPGTKPAGKVFFAVCLWVIASAGVAAIFWTIELVADMARWVSKRGGSAQARPLRHTGSLPEPSPGKRTQVRRAVKLLAEAGVFDAALDPAVLYAGIAERDEPVRPVAIFEALAEAGYYHPGFDPGPYTANLVRHETQVEQPEHYLVQQIADLARLSGGALAIADVAVAQSRRADGAVATRIAMTVNGESVTLAYAGAEKSLSTVLHHDLATRMRALGNGRRFGWLWDDAGPWISCLADGGVEALNAAFKLSGKSPWQWTWIDAEPPLAAGER